MTMSEALCDGRGVDSNYGVDKKYGLYSLLLRVDVPRMLREYAKNIIMPKHAEWSS